MFLLSALSSNVKLLIWKVYIYFYFFSYEYYPAIGMCSWGLVFIYPVDSIQFKILYFILVVLEFILPIVPITASCVISVIALRSSSFGNDNNAKRNATVNIILLTCVYLLFNIPMAIYLSMNALYTYARSIFSPFHTAILTNDFLQKFLMTHSIVLNSLFNALVYFWRLRSLRNFLTSFFTRTHLTRAQQMTGVLQLNVRGAEPKLTEKLDEGTDKSKRLCVSNV